MVTPPGRTNRSNAIAGAKLERKLSRKIARSKQHGGSPMDPMGYAAQAPGLLKMNFIFKMPEWYSELAVGTRFESSADSFMSLPLLCN
jgi:hypothetical protein